MTEQWHAVCEVASLAAEDKAAVVAGAWHVLVIRDAAGFHAFNDRCTHQAARLSPGRVRRGAIMCPLHGARFDVATGTCIGGAYAALRRFETRVEDGRVEVLVPNAPPGPQDRVAPL